MEQRYLIDSNAVIDYLAGKLPANGMVFMNEVVNSIPTVSVITKIEVLGYKTDPIAYRLLTDFMEVAMIMDLSDEVINRTIFLRKENKIKIPDAIIAATALEFDFILISRNLSDFKFIKNLQTINPHELTTGLL